MFKDSVKNIIFDLGNVIINIDSVLTQSAMKKLGFKEFEESYSLLKQTSLFDSLETGTITPEQFYAAINTHLKNKVSRDKINEAWGVMLLDFPTPRIDLIQNLKTKYRLFLLSNTNIIHYHQYNEVFINHFGTELNSLFEKAYYSFEIGMRKPDVEIYEYILKNSKLNPSESLFIDDSELNIEAAKKVGLQVMWIDVSKGDDIVAKLHGF